MDKVKQFEKILNKSGFKAGKIKNVEKLIAGTANFSYKLTTAKGNFLVRLSKRNTRQQVGYEIKLLDRLKNIPTPKLLQNRKKQKLFLFQNRPAIIYPYLPGIKIRNFNEKQIAAIGKFLGKFHKQTVNFHSTIKRYRFYECSRLMVAGSISNIKKKFKNYENEIDYLVKIIKNFRLPQNLPQGALHLDIRWDNLLFCNQKLSGVIDFDNSYHGPFILDLANALIWNCSKNGRLDLRTSKIFIDSYQKTKKLTNKEKNYLFQAVVFIYASHIYEDMYGTAVGYRSGKLPDWIVKYEMKNLFPALLKFIEQQKLFNKIIK